MDEAHLFDDVDMEDLIGEVFTCFDACRLILTLIYIILEYF